MKENENGQLVKLHKSNYFLHTKKINKMKDKICVEILNSFSGSFLIILFCEKNIG